MLVKIQSEAVFGSLENVSAHLTLPFDFIVIFHLLSAHDAGINHLTLLLDDKLYSLVICLLRLLMEKLRLLNVNMRPYCNYNFFLVCILQDFA